MDKLLGIAAILDLISLLVLILLQLGYSKVLAHRWFLVGLQTEMRGIAVSRHTYRLRSL